MAKPVIILHGYSDTGKNFRTLQKFLQNQGFKVASIYIGDYVTLEDQITIPDLAKAFCVALETNNIPTNEKSFDLVVHSTGALVAREWLTRYYLEEGKPCPVNRFLMLAPANFGSPLGHLGKTMVGRIIKGWKSNFQSGTQVLNALEMGSRYTWDLARRDIFGERSFYQENACMAGVLVGSKPYQKGLRAVVDKNGTDGTVYVCTANLNTSGTTVGFGRASEKATVTSWKAKSGPIPFGVFPDRDHSSICRPEQGLPDLGEYIVEFLNLTPKKYQDFVDKCRQRTATTLQDPPPAEFLHSYQNLVSRVIDDLGYPVLDYFLEFYEKEKAPSDKFKIDELMVKIHSEVLESVHAFSQDPSLRSFIFDVTDLKKVLSTGKKLMFSLSAAHLSKLIGYSAGAANDVSELPVPQENHSFWRANETLLAELVIERTQDEKAFKLSS